MKFIIEYSFVVTDNSILSLVRIGDSYFTAFPHVNSIVFIYECDMYLNIHVCRGTNP